MPNQDQFPELFAQLKALLAPYASRMVLTEDNDQGYSMNLPYSAQYQREVFFGAAQIKKNYVSFYVMPVYMFPDLLEDSSVELQKRMQGKSCFNFKKSDPAVFAELQALLEKSVRRLEQEGLLA